MAVLGKATCRIRYTPPRSLRANHGWMRSHSSFTRVVRLFMGPYCAMRKNPSASASASFTPSACSAASSRCRAAAATCEQISEEVCQPAAPEWLGGH